MTKLSVNINKIATLRNARGGNIPNVVQFAKDIEKFGGQGITVHPRPDERHIRYQDVKDLSPAIKTEFNIEGNPITKFTNLVLEVKPTQVTLVPDEEDAITSNAGWDTIRYKELLTEIIAEYKKHGIRTSIFVDPVEKMVEGAKEVGADRIELYTEDFARKYEEGIKEEAIKPYAKCARLAHNIGLKVNAGHDLSLENIKYFKDNVPHVAEVSIGHALIAEALYLGIEETIKRYLSFLK